MKGFIKYLFVLLLLTSFQQVNAQFRLIMEMAVTDGGKKMPGAEIKVFKNGSLVETVLTDAKGLADIPCGPNAIYTIEIGGNKGMVKKKLEINTKNVAPEGAKGDVFFPATVELFEKIEGMDLSILDKPIGKIKFDESYGDFDSDAVYTKTVQKQLAALEKDFLSKQAAAEAKMAGAMKEYEAAIKIADKAFAAEDWEKAAEQYKIAEKVNPDPLETYPSFQLAELKTKLIKIEKDNKQYNEAISKAEAAVSSKDYEIAIAEYKRASGYKPKEQMPKDKIKEVQGILANSAKVEQAYLAAIEKGDNALKINDMKTAKEAFTEAVGLKDDEAYPKNKLSEIDNILAKQEAKKAEYDNAIKAADDALAAKDYETAKTSYKKAATLKPTEQYPKDQIGKVDALIAGAAKLEQDYLAAIEKGDNALKANNFEEGKTAFLAASKLKPEEEYPKNKLKEIADVIAKNAAAEKEYNDKIAAGDKALAGKDYEGAKTAFNEAKTLKPSESYPATKITEIEGILANLAKAEENYKAAIAKGDAALESEDFETAKTAFNEALTAKPDESYPKDKLAEIETIVLKNQASEAEYKSAVQDGDDALADKNYEKAKEFYSKASGLKPEEAYPKDKISEIDKTVAEAAEKDKAYNDALAAADDAMNENQLENAKTSYQTASDLKPEETYPKEQITKIETQLAAAKELEANYAAAIKQGDEALAAKDYENAKIAYSSARELKDAEEYPKTKIAEIDGILAELKGKEEKYNSAIAKGDAALGSEDFEGAKAAYEEALALKDDEYPKGKLVEIAAKLKSIAEEKAANEKLEADYQAAIGEADQLGADSKFDEAIAVYTKASTLKPDEAYPKGKIEELTAAKENAAKAAELAEIQEKYDAKITEADAAFDGGDVESARSLYQEASTIKEDEAYPKEKIAAIDASLASAAENDANYKAAIGEADKLVVDEKFAEAKVKYQEASSIKPDQEFPKEKIVEMDERLAEIAAKQEEIRLKNEADAATEAKYQEAIAEADGLFNSEKFEEAKPVYEAAIKIKDDQYPKDKIAEIATKLSSLAEQQAAAEAQAKIDAEYDAIIAEADGLLASEDLDGAKTKYEAAIAVKDDQYPKDKIAEIETTLSALADADAAKAAAEAAEAERLAAAEAQAKIDAEYDAIIAEADGLLASEDLDGAKTKYEAAIAVKDDQYPKDKIAEIETTLSALADADAAKAAAEAAAAKKAAEEAAQAKIDAEYDAIIAEADGLLASEDLEGAKTKYEAAIAVKDDQYPKDKIAEIETTLSALADADAAKAAAEAAAAKKAAEEAAQAKIDAEYNALIAEADASFERKEFKPAKVSYEAALGLKDEQYPKDQINKIGTAMEAMATKQAAEAQKAKLEQDYLAAIEKGDQALGSNDLENAFNAFKLAASLKPDESYPPQKLAEIDALVAKRAEENAEQQAALKLKYDAFMAEGQTAMDAKDWGNAISQFQKAQNTLPNEEMPLIKMKEVKALQEELAAKAEQIRLRKEQAASNDAAYQTAIANGDKYIADKNYNDAENEYRLALSLKPEEVYPQEQLNKIKAIADAENAAKRAKEQARRAVLQKEQEYQDLITKGDNNFNSENYRAAKKSYESALRIKLNEPYPISQLKLLNDLLEKERLAEAQRRKDLDKPIQIQKGPKATITGDAEAEIERIYKELWAKQNSDKNAVLEEQQEVLAEIRKDNQEKEESRRQNAIEKLEEISISMKDQFEASSELNLQNYETLKEQEEDLMNTSEYRTKESEKRRANNLMDENLLEESIAVYNRERGAQILEGKKEMVENEYTEVYESGQNRANKQYEYILDSKEKFENLEARLMKFHQGRSTEFYPENYEQILKDEESWENKSDKDENDSEDRRLENLEKANSTNEEIHRTAIENAESFKNNQLSIEELEKELIETSEKLESESEIRRKKNEEEEYYIGEKKERQDQSSADYPQGVTEKIIENQNNSTTIRRIVVEGTRTDIYEKTLYKWGGTFYTKNGTNITQDIWDRESK